MQREVVIGRVSGVYGIQGWTKILSFTVPADNILHYSPWELRLLEGDKRIRVAVAESRRYKNGYLARLDAYTDRDIACQLIGADIVIARGRLPPVDEGEYYWADLIGCRVLTQDSTDLGQVERLIETGANDVLVVVGERERLIPFVSEAVILCDLPGRVIHVDWEAKF